MINLNNYMPSANNRKRQKVFRHLGFALNNFWTTVYYTRTKLGKTLTPETFCGTQSKNFHAKVLKVSLENTTTWKIKSLTFSLDLLCVPTKLTQITVLEASKMKQKSSMTDRVHQNSATVKNVKRYQRVKNACAVTKLKHFI